MRQQSNSLFRNTDTGVAEPFARVARWVTGHYEPAASNAFLRAADFYLIAHALAESHVIVTHEVPAISVKRVKIPNVCAGLNLRFMTPYEMLRREQARFVLGKA